MNRTELVKALRLAEVPDALFDIPGVHDIPIQPDAYFFLRPVPGGWVVGTRERSRDSVLARFAAEGDACAFLYDTLLRETPRPVPGGAQRIAEVLADRDNIQREAKQALDQAMRRRATGQGRDG
jgi:hypothetical protein